MLPIAHAGHWAIWVLYAVPLIIVVASIVNSLRRERRAAADGVASERLDEGVS